MMELEEKMKDPTNKERVRFLDGKDPTPGELQTKLEEVHIDSDFYLITKNVCFFMNSCYILYSYYIYYF